MAPSQGEPWEALGWFRCSSWCIQAGRLQPLRATSESSTLPWLALATRHLCQGHTAKHLQRSPSSHDCTGSVLSGKSEFGAEKKEEEHQELSMTSNKLCQREIINLDQGQTGFPKLHKRPEIRSLMTGWKPSGKAR